MERIDIAVLNYSTGRVTLYQSIEIEGDSENIEDFLVEKGHDLNNCHYMTGTNIQIDFEK